MKFLNQGYPELFDVEVDSGNALVKDGYAMKIIGNNMAYVTKNISNTVATASIYVQFRWNVNRQSPSIYAPLCAVFSTSYKIILFEKQTNLRITDGTNVLWDGAAPSTVNGSYYVRYIRLHIDTTQNFVNLYVNNSLIASVAGPFSQAENIQRINLGRLETNSYYYSTAYLNQIIISNDDFPITERVTEISPTISSTDWTVSSGVASADTVGDTMTLTLPSGSIDETKRTVTGYSAAFLNCVPSETINAVTVEQSGTTKQVVLPSNGAVETLDTFAVSSASDVSALVTAAYI